MRHAHCVAGSSRTLARLEVRLCGVVGRWLCQGYPFAGLTYKVFCCSSHQTLAEMWGDPRSSNRMDPFRRSQDERFASGWNRDFLARSDGLALERNAGVFQSGRDPYRPLELSGMLGPSGRQFASREATPFSFATRGLPIDFRGGDRMAQELQIRDLQARELASLDFRMRDPMTSEFRGREMHPMDYRIREELMMEYRERDGAAPDFRNRLLPPLQFKDRGVPHVDYRERELLGDFHSREAPPDRGRDMLDIDFRSKEQSYTELRETNVSDIDFRNRNQLLSDYRGKDGPHPEFQGNSSSPLDFRGKEGSQLEFRARDLPHSDFKAPGSSDLDMRGRDTTMFNFQGIERPGADQDFRERNVVDTTADIPDRVRLLPNQQLVDYMQSQPTVRTPERELHEDSQNKTGDPALGRSLYGEEQQTNNQAQDNQSCELPPDSKNSDGHHNINTAEDASAESARQPLSSGQQLQTPPGRGVKRGVDLDFLGRQDTDYRNMDYRDVDLRFDYGHGKAHVQERPAKEPRPDPQVGKSGRSAAKSSKIGESSDSHARSTKEEEGAKVSEDFDEFVHRVSTAVNAALDSKNTKVTDVDKDYRHAASGEECTSRFIQIHGLPADTDKKEVIEAIRSPDGKPIEDLQLSDFNPGYSNDSVCVEFPLLEQAIGCMESNQGSMVIGGKEVTLTYAPDPTDWFCEKCKSINVFSGGFCDQCNTSRHESDAISRQRSSRIKATSCRSSSPPRREKDSERRRREKDRRRHQGYDEVQAEQRNSEYDGDDGKHRHQQYDEDDDDDDHDDGKSKAMMIRPCFSTTTPETVVKAFAPIVHFVPENVRIIHSRSRGKSKSYGFIEMASHEEVLRVIGILATMNPPLKIDGKYVNGSVANRKPSGQTRTKKRKQPVWLSPGFAMQSAKRSIYAQNKRSRRSRSTGDSDENEADDSSFIYDPDTGYYVDPLSGMCYDPETKSEFPVGEKPDPSKASENRRDAREEKSAYSRATERTRHSSPDGIKKRPDSYEREKSRERAEQRRKERFRSPPLSKSSKNKDRNRGRRSISEQKDETQGWHTEKKLSRTRKAIFTEKDDSEDETPAAEDPFKKPLLPVMKKKEASPPPTPTPPPPAPVPVPAPTPVVNPLISLLGEYGGDSENEEEEDEEPPPPPRKPQPPAPSSSPPPPIPPKKEESNEDKLTDWTKLACLLCKRQFPAKEGLIRHQQLSELHQQNLAIHRRIKQSEKELEYLEMKEREVKRKEKGNDKTVTSQLPPETKRPKYSRTAQRDIDPTCKSESENGNKMKRTQQTTGKKGGRAGRNQHNRKSPEEGEDEDQGSQAKPYKRLPHESYRDAARKVMFARFKELM